MTTKSEIEWTEMTWNPTAGCAVLSKGCTNCYAMRLAARLDAMGMGKYKGLTRKTGGRYKWTGKVRHNDKFLNAPRKVKKPSLIFVNSMSDLFHDDVPLKFIKKVFKTINETPHHTYQVLTKRAERLEKLSDNLDWPDNLWMGVSVESKEYKYRIKHLRKTGAKIKFLSLEPLIGRLGRTNLRNIDWVIVGGESGPGARAMKEEWVRELRDQCIEKEIAFHFKQWGGVQKKKNGRELDGRTWDENPINYALPA
ncbi:MAG: phage Gp37/Gp68 family protein [Alphaproteobacteria bacterium]|nr:phage Gp37/Gp68 family protein [Alphaproteobacteria bacterium]